MCHLNKAKTDHHRILWSLQNTVTLVTVFWTTNSYFLSHHMADGMSHESGHNLGSLWQFERADTERGEHSS